MRWIVAWFWMVHSEEWNCTQLELQLSGVQTQYNQTSFARNYTDLLLRDQTVPWDEYEKLEQAYLHWEKEANNFHLKCNTTVDRNQLKLHSDNLHVLEYLYNLIYMRQQIREMWYQGSLTLWKHLEPGEKQVAEIRNRLHELQIAADLTFAWDEKRVGYETLCQLFTAWDPDLPWGSYSLLPSVLDACKSWIGRNEKGKKISLLGQQVQDVHDYLRQTEKGLRKKLSSQGWRKWFKIIDLEGALEKAQGTRYSD